jgi:hypothetical protein
MSRRITCLGMERREGVAQEAGRAATELRGGSSQRPHSTDDGRERIERRGEQNRAEGRGPGRGRAELLGDADHEGKVSSAARAARRVPDALGEACLRTVALAWSDGAVLLTVLVTER